ncbi:ABC transporter substrate-binding protein [Advenella faeciporci]|uniref:ABC transporter substrate-binding protein n=1 Tax=Advenella faeciporci TaxID=797535 RepID=A0A918JH32_9BURK|nr:tripartite tricarboxylate transporter substrate binding protein [Advenella faeciporci]NLY33184.1 tripartite tricarboxylate transporter substrate binding protein [Alcaligenaceae bacterium]GGW76797.1 ABC transporter substrate-binding protein [Advenella faeciporci]
MIKSINKLLLLTAVGVSGVAQAAWPEQPIRWVVPYPAGGGTDVIARTVAINLEKHLGKPLVIENRPGGGTSIGATAVANADPTGYVLGTADSGTLAFNPSLYKQLTYDPAKFTYLGGLARFPLVLAVPANSPYQKLEDLLEAARKEPGKLSASSAGAGSPHHLALERFKQLTNTDILHVPYRGAAPALQDLIGGRVDLMFADLGSGLPNIKAGKVRVLAVAVPERLANVLPDVPTMNEVGVDGFVAYAWQGLVGPGGLPQEVVEKVSADLLATLKDPEVSEKINAMGIETMPMTAGQFKAYSDKEREEWAKVIQAGNITLD